MGIDKGLSADALVFAKVWKQKRQPPRYVGIWRGRTAPPWRVGPSAPNRWSAEAPGLRPHGKRPYECKEQHRDASRAITNELRLSDNPNTKQRLRDHKEHILERSRHSGSLFQDKHKTAAQFACGIRWAELESIERYRRHDKLRWFIDPHVDDGSLDPNQSKKSEAAPRGLDTAIADGAGFKFEEVDNTVARRCQLERSLREQDRAEMALIRFKDGRARWKIRQKAASPVRKRDYSRA